MCLPVFTPATSRWTNTWYAPESFALPAVRPDEALIIGDAGATRSLFRSSGGTDPGLLSAMIAAGREFAPDRVVLFPHYSEPAMRKLREAVPAAKWARTDRMCWYELAGAKDWENELPRTRRQRRRRDRRKIAQHGLVGEVEPWGGPSMSAAFGLIPKHAMERYGTMDHEALARRRYEAWLEVPEVELLLFTTHIGTTLAGVVTAAAWRGRLTLIEIGLPGEESPQRAAAYIQLSSDLPVTYSLEQGLERIFVGATKAEFKTMRGASAVDMYFGYWDPSEDTA